MSKYTDRFLDNAKRNSNSLKVSNTTDPSIEMELDLDIPFEEEGTSSGGDDYEENIFNDASDVKETDDEIEEDLGEEEELEDQPESNAKRPDKSKKRKKAFQMDEEEQSEEPRTRGESVDYSLQDDVSSAAPSNVPQMNDEYSSIIDTLLSENENPSQLHTENRTIEQTMIPYEEIPVLDPTPNDIEQAQSITEIPSSEPISADIPSGDQLFTDPVPMEQNVVEQIHDASVAESSVVDEHSIIDTFLQSPNFEASIIEEQVIAEEAIAHNEELYQEIEERRSADEVIDHVITHNNEIEEQTQIETVSVVSPEPAQEAPDVTPEQTVDKFVNSSFENDFEVDTIDNTASVSSILNDTLSETVSPKMETSEPFESKVLSDAMEDMPIVILSDERLESAFSHDEYISHEDEKAFFEQANVDTIVATSEAPLEVNPDPVANFINEMSAFSSAPDEPVDAHVADNDNITRILNVYTEQAESLRTQIEDYISNINDALLSDDVKKLVNNEASTPDVISVLQEDIQLISQSNETMLTELATKYNVPVEELTPLIFAVSEETLQDAKRATDTQNDAVIAEQIVPDIPISETFEQVASVPDNSAPTEISETFKQVASAPDNSVPTEISESNFTEASHVTPISSVGVEGGKPVPIVILSNGVQMEVSDIEKVQNSSAHLADVRKAYEDTIFRGFLSDENIQIVKEAIIETNNQKLTSSYRLSFLRDERETKSLINSLVVRNVISSEYAEQVITSLENLSETKSKLGRVRAGKATKEDIDVALGASLSSEEQYSEESSSTKDANSTQKEQHEIKKTAENYKKQNLHAFTRMAKRVIADKMEQGGQMLTQTAVNAVADDGGVAEGVSDLKKMASPIATAASLIGLAAMSSKYKNELKEFGKAGSTIDDLLNRFNPISSVTSVKLSPSGKSNALIEEFSLDDLTLSKKALNKKLKKCGVRADIRKSIIKNRSDLYSMFTVRDEIMHIASIKGIPDELRKHLLSKNFFDMSNKKNVELLQMYFDNAPEDVIRNVLGHGKFQSMSKRDFKKFMKKFDENGISEKSQAASRLAEIIVNGRMARMKLGRKASSVLRGNFKKMINSITEEGGVADGAKDLSRATKVAVTIGRFGKKVLIGTRRGGYRGLLTNAPTGKLIRKILFGTKKGGYKGIVTQIVRFGIGMLKYADFMLLCATNGKFNVMKTVLLARKGLAKAGYATKQAAQAAGRAAKQKVIEAGTKLAKTKVGQTTQRACKVTSDFIKKRLNGARKAAEKLAKTKVIRAARKTARAVAVAKKTVKKTLISAIANFFSFAGRVKRILFIVALIVVLVVSLLFIAIDGILAILALIIGTTSTTILPEREEFLKELNDRYQTKFEQVKESAIELGSSTDLALEGLCGHTITRFGHPHTYVDPRDTDAFGHELMTEDWSTGFRIYYQDKNGNLLYNINNNIKDVITLAYVQTDGDFDIKDEDDAISIADQYFAYMNPQSVAFDEDDIELTFYFCDKCETVYYKCSDQAVCTKTDRIVEKQSDIRNQERQGVHFRTPIVTHENGDYVVCKSHEAQTPEGCDDYITKYYHSTKSGCTNWHGGACDGHTVYVNGGQCEVTYRSTCRGHKGDRQCGKEEHKHSLACYETVLACDIVDPKHVHVAGCYQKVQTCILEEHMHGSWMSPTNNGCYNTIYHDEISGIASHGKMETSGACTSYDIYCTGHSVDACYGHYDSKIFITLLTKEDVFEDNFSAEQGLLKLRPGWKEEGIQWADNIYKQNWYELYGFDPAGGLGFDTEETLSSAQIAQIVNSLDTSKLRKDIVKSALSQVGVLPFYSGGKPTAGSIPIRTNVGMVGNRASFEDSSGNAYAGLDGFGFSEWAYWNASGSDLLPEGRTIRATDVFNGTNIGNLIPISEEDLEIGDLGFQAGHCGIYCGIINEKPVWVHCKPGSVNTVTFEPYAAFTKFFKVKGV